MRFEGETSEMRVGHFRNLRFLDSPLSRTNFSLHYLLSCGKVHLQTEHRLELQVWVQIEIKLELFNFHSSSGTCSSCLMRLRLLLQPSRHVRLWWR